MIAPPRPAPGLSPLPSLAALRDLPLRVELPPALEAEITRMPPPPAEPGAEALAWYEAALRVTQRCQAHLDGETTRLTEAVFSNGDPTAAKQRLVGDLRKQVDNQLAAIKQKLNNEKTDWGRRYTKQLADVQEGLAKQLDGLTTAVTARGGEMHVALDPAWRDGYRRWFDEVVTRWAGHIGGLLKEKSKDAVQREVADLAAALETTINIRASDAPPISVPPIGDLDGLSEKVEVASPAELFIEVLKVALGTVGMVAGLILVPVLGNLFPHETTTHMKAGLMALFCAPIIVFAVLKARSQRRKLVSRNADKAGEQLRKDLADLAKSRLDRFKLEADRAVAVYLQSFQQGVLEQLDPYVEATFRKREAGLASELASLKLQTDRVQDQLTTVRQAKTQLSGQLVVDLRRRIKELGGAA